MKKPNTPLRTPTRVLFGVIVLVLSSIPNLAWAQAAGAGTEPPPADAKSAVKTTSLEEKSRLDETLQLSPFQVKATSEEDGYAAYSTLSSSRIALNYIDSTQSISVVTSQFIKDYSVQDVRRLMMNVPNVIMGESDNAASVQIRGIRTGSIYVDGVIMPGTYTALPLQFYDRVEVVKGPASAAFGIGQPGGLINYVTKTPTGANKGTFDVSYGDHQNYAGSFDLQGRLPQYGKVSYRVVGFWNEGNYPIEVWHHRGTGGLVALRDDLNDTTTVSVSLANSRSTHPMSNDVLAVYKHPSAYAGLRNIFGPDPFPVFKTLPNTPAWPGNPASFNGNWTVGTQLLPDNFEPLPNFLGTTTDDFRTNIVVEKSLLDRALTVRYSGTFETQTTHRDYSSENGLNTVDDNNVTTILPATGDYAHLAFPLVAATSDGRYNFRAHNLDLDFQKKLLGGEWRATIGGYAQENNSRGKSINIDVRNADGSPRLQNLAHPDRSPINFNSSVSTVGSENTTKSFSWGGYLNVEATYFDGMLNLAAGDRADWGGTTSNDILHNRKSSTGAQKTKGAPRYSVRIKPLKWLSIYGTHAEHNDPGQFTQLWVLAFPGDITQATKDKYHNFDNPIAYTPGGKLDEVGAKAELLGGKILVSVALFKESTTGTVFDVPIGVEGHIDNGPGKNETQIVKKGIGGDNVKGCEVEIAGRLTNRFLFTANYGITRGRRTDIVYTDPVTTNVTILPNHVQAPATLSFHGRYDFGDLHGNGFYVLAGGTHWGAYPNFQGYLTIGSSPAHNAYTETESQYVLDGGIGYKWGNGRQSVDFTMSNILRKTPFLGAVNIFVGGPREQAFLKYTYKF